MEVLAAFVREHSRERWPVPEPGFSAGAENRTTRSDVQAALTVIIGRNRAQDTQVINLARAVLPAANMAGATIGDVDLTEAVLARADLINTNLVGSTMARADLTEAQLIGANLQRTCQSR